MTDIDDWIYDWDAPTCLRWLANYGLKPNHYRDRAENWAEEVRRFASYEGIDPDEWDFEATNDLRHEVRRLCGISAPGQKRWERVHEH